MLEKNCSLAPYVEILEHNDALHVAFGSIGIVYNNSEDIDFVYSLLNCIGEDRHIPDEFYRNDFTARQTSILKELQSRNIIIDSGKVPEYGRNHRDELYYVLNGLSATGARAALSEKSVCIIGCGGIGCIAATTLATAGIGILHLMDDDTVEIHNISRQFAYTEKDVGKHKVHVLQEYLNDRNSAVKINVINERANFDLVNSNIPAADCYLMSADQRGILSKANRYFVEKRAPYMHSSYINDIAVWGPFVTPGKSGCWACQKHTGTDAISDSSDRTKLLKRLNATYTCPIISPISQMASALVALDILKYLTGSAMPYSTNKRLGLWTNKMEIETQDFSRNPNCKICGSH